MSSSSAVDDTAVSSSAVAAALPRFVLAAVFFVLLDLDFESSSSATDSSSFAVLALDRTLRDDLLVGRPVERDRGEVAAGEAWVEVHAADEAAADGVQERLASSLTLSHEPPPARPLVIDRM